MHDIKSASDAARLILFGSFLIAVSFISRWIAMWFERREAPDGVLVSGAVLSSAVRPAPRTVREPAPRPAEPVGVGASDSNAHA
jgi:hypothetical protein